MSMKIVSDLFISLKNPVETLKCTLSFSKLTEQEKFYAYYFQKAAWEGSKMNMFQRSYESPGLILLIHTFFFQQNFEEIKQKAFQSLGEESWNYFAAYCAGIFGNLGNFRGFGDTKFIPQVSQEQFQQILQLNQGKYATYITQIWERVKKNVYDSQVTLVDFPQNNGVNSFYSPNMKQEEAQLVTDFLKSVKAAEQAINSRLWKIQNELILKIPSLNNHLLNVTGLEKEQEYNNRKIKVQTGDFDFIVQRVVNYLSQVLPYVANETQQDLIREYIKHFVTGDINLHKESQKYWVKDKGPVVETMIGFIENYVDPLHIRADFEAFVAIVNKDRSMAYAKVVNMAPQILAQFPWSNQFEKEEFKAPDFTGLDVVTFASQSVPIGIHIPNYHDICENYGSKNVVLENNMPIITAKNSNFIKEEDLKIYIEEGQTALGLNVALHELIGHGSGRHLQEKQEGEQITLNFDQNTLIDPVSNTHVQTWYKIGENYETVFGKFKSAFEECRAESTALYQSCFSMPYPAFDITDEQRMQKICFTLWLNMVYSGIKGLKFYNVENKQWTQAHCQARFAIFKCLYERSDLLTLEMNENQDYFYINLVKDKIKTVGKEQIGNFLQKIHIYKCTANFKAADEFFNHYSQVDEYFLKLREIVLANDKPRKLVLQSNLLIENQTVVVKEYEENFEGIIKSFIDRFQYFDHELFDFWSREWDLLHSEI